jgi:hypothetical protein
MTPSGDRKALDELRALADEAFAARTRRMQDAWRKRD